MKAPPSQHICSECDLVLPANLPEILCPRCALREFENGESAKFPRPFGNYELLEEIGRGGMGVVYRARQLALDRIVAVKVVLNGSHAAPELLRRFQIEARAGGKLRHRNFISVHEVGTHEGHSFLAMDFVKGVPLSRLVESGPLTPRRAAAYAVSIARAIAHAHEHGVMHRDLKPSNILIDSDDEVRVSDFGLARTADQDGELTALGQVLGSPNYMSPEQVCGVRERIGPSTDIYSIGAVLYFLLIGRPPFEASSVLEMLRAVMHEPVRSIRAQNARVTQDLETICLKCLSKDPKDRYASASELADDLDRFLRFEPIRARPASWSERAIRWSQRNPAAAALIVVFAIGSFALSGALYLANQEEKRKTEAIKIISHRLGKNIEELWKQDEKLVELVTSEELAALAGNYKERVNKATRFRLAIKPPETPLDLQKLYQPFLDHVEGSLAKSLGVDVRIDLAMSNEDSVSRVVAPGEITLSRMGAVKYLDALDAGKPISMLVQEIAEKEAQIFVHRDSPLRKLSDLRGRTMMFAEKKATISEWAKFYLVREANITGGEFRDWQQSEPPTGSPLKTHSHRPAIEAVLTREFDAGVARSKYVALELELRPIFTFESTPNVWVISSQAPRELRDALVHTLLKIRDRGLLQSAPTRIEGFAPVNVQMLRNLQNALGEEVRRFEQR